jgi:hypothetical protein
MATMTPGGRAADLLGRRRILVAGIMAIGVSSLIGGLAQSSGVLVGARSSPWRRARDRGMLLLVDALVKAPTAGWGSTGTVGEVAGALALMGAFVVNELRHRNPLAPLSIFRINGLGFSQQPGWALGLAIFTAIPASHTHHLAAHAPVAQALTAGFGRALVVGSVFILAAAMIGLRATNTRGDSEQPTRPSPSPGEAVVLADPELAYR